MGELLVVTAKSQLALRHQLKIGGGL